MKKLIVFLFCVSMLYMLSNFNAEEIVIPTDSIRLRIIANSNKTSDQLIKLNVKEKIDNIIYNYEKNTTNINEARNEIKEIIPEIDSILTNFNLNYTINYGQNLFPEKTYKGVKYNEGMYESLVITIGEGIGENWWCVLFPPLCLIDENINDKEYSFFVADIINKYI